MMHNISWTGYFYAVLIILAVYYAAILLKFYKRPLVAPGPTLKDILGAVESIIREAAQRNFPKEELLLALQLELRRRQIKNDKRIKELVSQFIWTVTQMHGSIHLAEEEVETVWM